MSQVLWAVLTWSGWTVVWGLYGFAVLRLSRERDDDTGEALGDAMLMSWLLSAFAVALNCHHGPEAAKWIAVVNIGISLLVAWHTWRSHSRRGLVVLGLFVAEFVFDGVAGVAGFVATAWYWFGLNAIYAAQVTISGGPSVRQVAGIAGAGLRGIGGARLGGARPGKGVAGWTIKPTTSASSKTG